MIEVVQDLSAISRHGGARNRREPKRGPSAPVINPPPSTGLELYLDSRLGVALSGSDTTQWSDQSGMGRHYSEAVLCPQYEATGGPGGKPCLLFSGASYAAADQLVGPSFAALASGGELFMLIKQDVDPPATGQGGLYHFGADAASEMAVPFTDGVTYDSFGTSARKDTGINMGDWAAWSLYNVTSAGAWTARFNRALQYTVGGNTVSWAAVSRLGRTHLTRWLNGRIACVLIYNAASFGVVERAAVENWFLSEWGV